MTESDQQVPLMLLFQLYSTGVHCGKIIAASIVLVIVLNAMKHQKKTLHFLLVRLKWFILLVDGGQRTLEKVTNKIRFRNRLMEIFRNIVEKIKKNSEMRKSITQ